MAIGGSTRVNQVTAQSPPVTAVYHQQSMPQPVHREVSDAEQVPVAQCTKPRPGDGLTAALAQAVEAVEPSMSPTQVQARVREGTILYEDALEQLPNRDPSRIDATTTVCASRTMNKWGDVAWSISFPHGKTSAEEG